MLDYPMLIGGELAASSDASWDVSVNPANEEPLGRSPAATRHDVDRAVKAASEAWPQWWARGPGERGEILNQFARAIEARADDIARLEAQDSGNTFKQVHNDIKLATSALRYYAGVAYELKGDTIPGAPGMLHMTVREPYGIVVRIVPFNHPMMFAVARTAAALAAGNALLVKAPETSPLSILMLGEIARSVMPAGVFNIITGSGAVVGDALVRHRDVKRIAFIGADGTGRAIQKAAAESGVKHVSLELGGKNPMIVFPDCDVDKVAAAAVRGANFTWQGQSCGSTSRIMIHEDIYDAVAERILEGVAKIKVGDPLDAETTMGPLNSRAHLDRVLGYVERGLGEGAKLQAGGGRPAGAGYQRGYWMQPTVFGDVSPDMTIAREEIFGPVISLMRWSDVDDAIRVANDTEYGLATAIWTRDLDRALKTAQRVQSGFVWVNTVSGHYRGVGFGGQKASGIGREEGLEEMFSYTEEKAINIALG